MSDVVLVQGLDAVIQRYADYGPLAAAFLANLLATFGDKGQLVVVTLAARYGAKRVFVGAMGAFAAWSALEVLFGQTVVRLLPAGAVGAVTGGLFLVFGAWTLHGAVDSLRSGTAFGASRADADTYRRPDGGAAGGGGGAASAGGTGGPGIAGRYVPAWVARRVGSAGGVATSFVFVAFAEFGDKTQLLTINLAATFPDAPGAVFVGVVAALGLRTGVDAIVGDRVERWLPVTLVEVAAAAVFVAFGLLVLGVVPVLVLLSVLGAVAGLFLGWLATPVTTRQTAAVAVLAAFALAAAAFADPGVVGAVGLPDAVAGLPGLAAVVAGRYVRARVRPVARDAP